MASDDTGTTDQDSDRAYSKLYILASMYYFAGESTDSMCPATHSCIYAFLYFEHENELAHLAKIFQKCYKSKSYSRIIQ